MLLHLTINNLAVIEQVEINFEQGFCALTGETGAGKSIAIDALNLCLGKRADPKKIRKGGDSAVVSASFDLSNSPDALEVLDNFNLSDGEGGCVIRRHVSSNGRSKAFINGHPVSLSQLSSLGVHLVSICAQNEQYALLLPSNQLNILDRFGGHNNLLLSMKKAYTNHTNKKKEINELLELNDELKNKEQLLTYQVKELDELSPEEGEFQALEDELSKLSHGNELKNETSRYIHLLSEGSEKTLLSELSGVLTGLEQLTHLDKDLVEIVGSMDNAYIELQDACQELRRYSENIDTDPQRLHEVSERHASYVELSRKHHVKPDDIFGVHQSLADELKKISDTQEGLEDKQIELAKLESIMFECAENLHKERKISAKKLSEFTTSNMSELGMIGGAADFVLRDVTPEKINETGYDNLELLVLTNTGEDRGNIANVASGGELSRLSLILQVAIAGSHLTPTLIFDEVDSGISGQTAAIVGKMIRKLSEKTQVISITHLPQVASFAHSHLYVCKEVESGRTRTLLKMLNNDERVDEMARLLGGVDTSDDAKRNAITLLEIGQQ